jgi:hypothetical protein
MAQALPAEAFYYLRNFNEGTSEGWAQGESTVLSSPPGRACPERSEGGQGWVTIRCMVQGAG